MQWPQAFVDGMQDILGQETSSFLESLGTASPVSIRYNPLKAGGSSRGLDPVPWCPEGEYLPERPVFTLDPLFHAGAYYVQEASSMFIGWLYRQLELPKGPVAILDLCAAPGGKSTHLASLLREQDLLVANEPHPQRATILDENLVRWGHPQVLSTRKDPHMLAARWPERFGVVLVDAPCSGEGMFRKDPGAIAEWSEENVRRCATRQGDILDHAVRMLSPGGYLIYSTCTWNPSEDEAQIKRMTERYPLEVVSFPIDPSWGIREGAPGWRFYPHRLRGEGFYCCVLRKTEPTLEEEASRVRGDTFSLKLVDPGPASGFLDPRWRPQVFESRTGEWAALPLATWEHHADLVTDRLMHRRGVHIGSLKGKDLFVPDHELALSALLHPDAPSVELDREQALRFLRKDPIEPNSQVSGIRVVRNGGCALGWAKFIPGRVNNLLPHHLRIRI